MIPLEIKILNLCVIFFLCCCWASPRVEPTQRARTRLDEILENLNSPRAPDQPLAGRREEPPRPQEKPQPEKTSGVKAEDAFCRAAVPSLKRQKHKSMLFFVCLFVSDYQKPSRKKTSPSAPTSPPWRLRLKAASPADSQSGAFVCVCLSSMSLLYS